MRLWLCVILIVCCARLSAGERGLYEARLHLAISLLKPVKAEKPEAVREPEPTVKKSLTTEPKRHLYYFTADWCEPCWKIKQEVIPQLRASGWTQEWLTTVDIDRNGELKKQYQIDTIPAFVVVKNGKVLGKRTGYVGHVELAKWANGLE